MRKKRRRKLQEPIETDQDESVACQRCGHVRGSHGLHGDRANGCRSMGCDCPSFLDVPGRCLVCETPLTLKHGYAHSGMCGPCCTGDSSTLEEFGDTW